MYRLTVPNAGNSSSSPKTSWSGSMGWSPTSKLSPEGALENWSSSIGQTDS